MRNLKQNPRDGDLRATCTTCEREFYATRGDEKGLVMQILRHWHKDHPELFAQQRERAPIHQRRLYDEAVLN